MLHFQPSDPYPLIAAGKASYAEQLAHAAAVDRWLGLRTEEVERRLNEVGCRLRAPGASGEVQKLWFGLDVQALLTPYTEIRQLLELLRPHAGQTIVDLGAAYGRMGFVIGREMPKVSFVGYEYVGERVDEGRRALARFGYASVRLEHRDLSAPEFTPVLADYYFIYDFGTPKAIEKALHDLRRISRERPIAVIGRGRQCRYLIETRHQWLGKADPAAAEQRTTTYVSDPNAFGNLALSSPRSREPRADSRGG